MKKFTPGPWFATKEKESNGYWFVGPKKIPDIATIYFTWNHNKTAINNTEANANIISSAPEMYYALKILLELLQLDKEKTIAYSMKELRQKKQMKRMLMLATKAIAKAEGRT
jgi:hypothetical protein